MNDGVIEGSNSYYYASSGGKLYRMYVSGDASKVTADEIVKNGDQVSSTGANFKNMGIDENEYTELKLSSAYEYETGSSGGSGGNSGIVGSKLGFDANAYNSYRQQTGLAAITEDSGVDELVAVFKSIENDIKSIERNLSSLDVSKGPQDVDTVMRDLALVDESISELGSIMGLNLPTSTGGNVAMIAGGTVVAGTVVAGGLAAGGVIASGTAIAATCASIPVAGWIAAGVIAVGLIGYGIYNAVANGDAEKKFNQLKENLQQANGQVSNDINQVKNATESTIKSKIVPDFKNELGALLDDNFNFDDIDSIKDITKDLDKMVINQAKIEEWKALCDTYGFNSGDLDGLLDKLGKGNDKFKHANEYIEQYAEHIKGKIETSKDVVSDTDSFMTSAGEIAQLIQTIAGGTNTSQLDTEPLEHLLQFVQKTNQDDINADIANIQTDLSNWGGYGAGGSLDLGQPSASYNLATGNQTGVDGAAGGGVYDVDTKKYNEAQEAAKKAAQDAVDNYLKSVTTDGKSVAELEQLYGDVEATKEENKQYADELSVNLDGFAAKLQEIREAQDKIVTDYLAGISIDGQDISGLQGIYTSAKAQDAQWASESTRVDLTGFDTLYANIKQSVSDQMKGYIGSIDTSGKTVQELEAMHTEIGETLASIQGFAEELELPTDDFTKTQEYIRAVQQDIVNTYATEAQSQIEGSAELMSISNVKYEVRDTKTSLQGIEVDTGALDQVDTGATDKMQNLVETQSTVYSAEADMVTNSTDATTLLTTVSTYKGSIPDPELSTQSLDATEEKLNLKIEQLIEEEAAAEEDSDGTGIVVPHPETDETDEEDDEVGEKESGEDDEEIGEVDVEIEGETVTVEEDGEVAFTTEDGKDVTAEVEIDEDGEVEVDDVEISESSDEADDTEIDESTDMVDTNTSFAEDDSFFEVESSESFFETDTVSNDTETVVEEAETVPEEPEEIEEEDESVSDETDTTTSEVIAEELEEDIEISVQED